ncbi:MAG TPA: hypothetical protein DGH68_02090 [Bacteroidetes bacterium]|jgi:hypothetical protein|nr:hypothetical protein [Bacteroidota bacterium]
MIKTMVVLAVILSAVSTVIAQNTFTGGQDNNWNTAANWSAGHAPTAGEDVVIPADMACVVDVNTALIDDLTVEAGGQLIRNSNLTVRYVNVSGNIVCDGIVGNGAVYDALGFNIEGVTCGISGSGVFDAALIRKNASTNLTTTLTISRDISLQTSTTGIYSNANGTTFNVVIASSATVNIPYGSVAIDGLNGATGSGSGGGGNITVQGTCNVGKSLYLTTDNVAGACVVNIANGGVLKCSTAVCTNSGAATSTLDVDVGGELNFTWGGWGTVGATNNTYVLDGTVGFSAAGSQSVIGPCPYSDLVLSGTGVKTLSSVTVNGTMYLRGSVTVSGTPTYGASSVLAYEGSTSQTTSLSNEFSGVKNLKIENASGVILGSDVSVTGTISFVAGSISTNGYTLALGSNGLLSGEQVGRNIVGNVATTRDVQPNSAQTFGNIGLSVDGTDATALGSVTVSRVTGDNAVVSVGANSSIKRRYTISGGGNLARNVTFVWLQSEDNGKGPNNMGIWQNTSTTWSRVGNSENVSGNPRSITRAITSLSGSFTATDDLNPLPIQLASFIATPVANGVRLAWRTLTELNNYGFFIQQSAYSASGFADIEGSFVPGHGTTNLPHDYTFTAASVQAGQWCFRLKQMDMDGTIHYSDPVQVELPTGVTEGRLAAFRLLQNYPNPFNPSTNISFTVESAARAVVSVYNILGQHVATLFDGPAEPGRLYSVAFSGENVVSGSYYYALESGGNRISKMMMLVK